MQNAPSYFKFRIFKELLINSNNKQKAITFLFYGCTNFCSYFVQHKSGELVFHRYSFHPPDSQNQRKNAPTIIIMLSHTTSAMLPPSLQQG